LGVDEGPDGMIGDHDTRRGLPPGQSGYADPRYGAPRQRSGLNRFLGGSPAAVAVKLLFLSVLVGAVMAMLGLTPGLLFWQIYDLSRHLIDLGFETFHDFGRWILAGAAVVVPIWFIARLLTVSRDR
jgi:hypothetical protein